MQPGDRIDQGKAEAAAAGRPAGVGPVESFARALQSRAVQPRAPVPHRKAGGFAVQVQFEIDRGRGRRIVRAEAVFDRIVDQVGAGLEQQVPVAAHGCRPVRQGKRQLRAGILDQRLVQVRNVL